MNFQHRFVWSSDPIWTVLFAQASVSQPLEQPPQPLLASRLPKLPQATAAETRGPDSAVPLRELRTRLSRVAADPAGPLADDWLTDSGLDPKAIEREVQQRLPLLQQQWLARGPGLWRWLEQVIPARLQMNSPQLIGAALPAWGGAALPLAEGRGAAIEALLHDCQPELPEVLRVTQALLQSNFDATCPAASPSARFAAATSLAVAAGDWVELTRWSQDTLSLAFKLWWPIDQPASLAPLKPEPFLGDPLPAIDPAGLQAWIAGQLDSNAP